ncbi:Resolvase family protein [uncultured Desulfobacterium sp.]|uniref:Resolvase family protein n=1 Tax=uncultured Desulfobacterium sp. TaxID=201089 RepID=A0A445MRC9_9BACT|nr:Resolvase family protein [uncultured Desulfobacterium sp.]SPD74569.1 Resolvase family protein [uncultured Desulfobacterium sp.]
MENKRKVYVPKGIKEKKYETVITFVEVDEDKSGPRTMAYLRVSTDQQDTEKNKADVLKFANDRDFGQVIFVEETVSGKKNWKERKISSIIDELTSGDRIVTPELSRLGRSTLEVLEILKVAKDKGISIYSVKENLSLNGDDMQSKVMSTMLALFADLERDFISQRTKEGLRMRKEKGIQLGRPKGPGRSKLDDHKEEIIALLKNGSTKVYVARRYETSIPNLFNWIKKNGLDVKAE